MERTDYIGSSDAREILSGRWDKLWRKKRGLIPEEPPSFAMRLGQAVEPLHLEVLSEQLGEAWQHSTHQPGGDQHFSLFRPEGTETRPPIGSHPDILLRHQSGAVYAGEVKITGRWKSIDEALDFYMPQLQHHMLAWGHDRILLSVIIGTHAPEKGWVGASEEWQHYYIEKADAFWKTVLSGDAPGPLIEDDVVRPLVPTAIRDSVPINGKKKRSLAGSNRAVQLIADFIRTKAAVAEHDAVKKELKAMMQDDECELYHDALTLKRDARGAIRITVHDEAFGKKEAA